MISPSLPGSQVYLPAGPVQGKFTRRYVALEIEVRQPSLFDYASLQPETRATVQRYTVEIKALMKRAAQDIIEIGQRLIEVKAALGHGHFGAWLSAEFDWDVTSAWRFMNVATRFCNLQDLEIAPSALYLLAAPSTPEAARQEAIERAEAGEEITYSAAREIVAEFKELASSPAERAYEGAAMPWQETHEMAPPSAYYGPPVYVPEPAPAPLAGHQLINASASNEWYTPAPYVDAARLLMGGIDLDPASNPIANQAVKADRFYTIDDDGLAQEWAGRVFLNPPYGIEDGDSNQARWSRRLIEEYRAGNVTEAVLLVNAVPGNIWFAPLWDYPICFVGRRIRFYNEDTEVSAPTHSNVFVYLGPQYARFVSIFSQFGVVAARLVVEGNDVSIDLGAA